jgi:hypothetical protein
MSLPEWLADKISSTPEYKAKFSMNQPITLDVVVEEDSDSLPF